MQKINTSITNKIKQLVLLLALFSLASCSSGSFINPYHGFTSKNKLHRKLSKEDRGHKKYRGHYKVGKPYKVKGVIYKPREVTRYVKTGLASWYGKKDGFHGKKTANGDVYNCNTLTAAHPTLPMPSLVRVKNLSNGKSLIVMINDRGPFSSKRIIDLSERTAKLLGIKHKGVGKVKIKYLHSESNKFLRKLGLSRKPGARAKRPLPNPKCSVNCQIKKINLKYKYLRK